MNRSHIIPIGAVFLLVQVFAAPTTLGAHLGQWGDEELRVVAPRSANHLFAHKWNPEKDEAPVSPHSAVVAARAALRKMVGEVEASFRCDRIEICGQSWMWYYVVFFRASHPSALTGRDGRTPHVLLPFIVYLDGFVESPTKSKKPNKAPEPTPMSVTPPAAQESRRP